jgi:hypothetical protein
MNGERYEDGTHGGISSSRYLSVRVYALVFVTTTILSALLYTAKG